jgi:hypothetical protein
LPFCSIRQFAYYVIRLCPVLVKKPCKLRGGNTSSCYLYLNLPNHQCRTESPDTGA